MDSKLYGLILAGGSGVRLWPASREELPKQFLSLLGDDESLLQGTLRRLMQIEGMNSDNLKVVAGSRWRALVLHQARLVDSQISDNFVLEEPCAKNTAPAIILGALQLKEQGASGEDIVLVCPSDHIIKDTNAFKKAIETAIKTSSDGWLTILGITPTSPDTGFGYVKRGEQILLGTDSYEVKKFVEKPNLETAEKYVQDGEYFWNGGIFVFRLGQLFEELAKTSPELMEAAHNGAGDFLANFEKLPSISFDYAVMEKAQRVAMVTLDAGWSDVGSWDALHEVLDKEEGNNAFVGDVMNFGSRNCLVRSKRLTAIVDVEDLTVIDSPDALFISKRGSSQRVRDVVARIKKDGRKEASEAPENARPWGTYSSLFNGNRFKIKHIVITPGKKLSLQYHHHRSEHWIVVRGTALITLEGEQKFLHEGESVFIRKNAQHRLENPGKIPLEIVEVQGGEYLGEDDIVRIDDDFGRV